MPFSIEPAPVKELEESPFESVESAHEYVGLLIQAVADARESITAEIEAAASREPAARNGKDALRLADYKLEQLGTHLRASSRILNDLRSLRRMLFNERADKS